MSWFNSRIVLVSVKVQRVAWKINTDIIYADKTRRFWSSYSLNVQVLYPEGTVLLDWYITVGGAVLQAQLQGKLPEFLTQAGGGGRDGKWREREESQVAKGKKVIVSPDAKMWLIF